LMATPGYGWVRAQWAIWRGGGVFVPVGVHQTAPEIEHFIKDTKATIGIADAAHEHIMKPVCEKMKIRFQLLEDPVTVRDIRAIKSASRYVIAPNRFAMVVYTAGTTGSQGKPKGVVTTFNIIEAQVLNTLDAWGWSKDDMVLHALPLNHNHGMINALITPLYAGAAINILPKFDTKEVWTKIIEERELNIFMGVPLMYAKLIAEFDRMTPEMQRRATDACKRFRIFACGSAPLPLPIMERWKQITSHVLLERYGMTEIGVALTNPYQGGERIHGTAGKPVPNADCKVVDSTGKPVTPGEPGELRVKASSVFKEYWNRPDWSRNCLDETGFFKTGDNFVVKDGVYTYLGTESLDVVKTGGIKVSGLEIEKVLLTHPDIADCAIVPVPDETWGQAVSAVLVQKPDTKPLDVPTLKLWAKPLLSPSKIPKRLLIVSEIAKTNNKPNKKDLIKLFEEKKE